jgi:hypothetical protein
MNMLGVPLELWEVKARHSSHVVEVSLSDEDRLRSIALNERKAEREREEQEEGRKREEEERRVREEREREFQHTS